MRSDDILCFLHNCVLRKKLLLARNFVSGCFYFYSHQKESHGSMHSCEFPVSVLKTNTVTVYTETNQVVVTKRTVERDGKHIREQDQQYAHFIDMYMS
jgi:hypothetical protein